MLKQAVLKFARPMRPMTDQLSIVPAYLRRRDYDIRLRRKVQISNGKAPRGKNVAIILAFQPDQLLGSLFYTLRHLISRNITPILVVNHDLTGAQKERLEGLCHSLITRPNIGYDFGGYREGVLHLLENGPLPENLILINDSVWFPIEENCSLIDRALTAPEDLFGVFHDDFYSNKNLHHVPSFFYRFSARVVQSDAFKSYWQTLPFYARKSLVIRGTEMAATSYFVKRGFSVGSLYQTQDLIDAVKTLDTDRKLRVARYFASIKSPGNDIFKGLTDHGPNIDAKLDQAMQESRFRNFYIDNHPFVLRDGLSFPVLKKNREFRFWTQRKEMQRFGYIETLPAPVRQEVERWDQNVSLIKPPHEKKFVALQEKWDI